MADKEDTTPTTSGETSFDFGKKKKKKKTTTTTTTPKKDENENEPEKEAPEEDDEKESTPVTSSARDSQLEKEIEFKEEGEEHQQNGTTQEIKLVPMPTGNEDYSYEQLASRIFGMIHSSRPEEKTVYKMKPPVVYREGTQKTVWVNFPEICKIMSRSPEHVLAYALAEVGSTGSIDGSARLVIKGKFQPKHIENILRRYIAEYVKCHTCKSPETTLKKENRLTFMVCDKCGSSRSVTAIKSGFQATTRASRRAQKTT